MHLLNRTHFDNLKNEAYYKFGTQGAWPSHRWNQTHVEMKHSKRYRNEVFDCSFFQFAPHGTQDGSGTPACGVAELATDR